MSLPPPPRPPADRNRHNFERVRAVSGDSPAGSRTLRPEGLTGTSGPSPDTYSVLLSEVLLPILDRVNASLDELEQAVARIAEAPYG